MEFKNFNITETIYESSKTLIYRALRKSDSAAVIIKIRKNAGDAYLLKHEYDILKGRHIDGVVNVINALRYGEIPYLVFEDKKGIVLSSYIKDKSLTQREFVTIAKNAAASLAAIHSNNIIHRDIKPANMLINAATLDVSFIDFGISASASSDYTLPRDGFVGTIAFISPEQTGRVDYGVDFRSDLYSLGITLYYLLTKRMPFEHKTDMQLIHAHITSSPPPPSSFEGVSPVLSDIVMKLIQKSPDDRYPSAESLEHDLSVCLEQLHNDRMFKKFRLGESDSSGKLVPDNFLMGKDAPLKRLNNIFDQLSGQRAGTVILKGPPFSGKSGLLNGFRDYAVKSGGLFIRVVCDYKKRAEPYFAVNQAFFHYYSQLVDKGADTSGLKQALLYNLGENTAALFRIMPFFEEILGKREPLMQLSYIEEKRRNSYVFNTFLQTLTSAAQPIVLTVDNAQSADRQSLQLLLGALNDENTHSFMLILSVRPEDVEKAPLTEETIASFDQLYKRPVYIKLEYLKLGEIKVFLDDLLGASKDTDALAEFILNSTGGRPHEISSLINLLGSGKFIKFDNQSRAYSWDLNEIKKVNFRLDAQSKYDDIYNALSANARELLEYVSVFGNTYFDITLDKAHLDSLLEPLLNAGILGDSGRGVYTFNDSLFRVYVTNRIPQDKLQSLHYEIGARMLETYRGSDKWDSCCEGITGHLNTAGELVSSEKEKLALARLNFESGNKSLSLSNAANAALYYKRAFSVIGDKELFEKDYRLAAEVSINYALSCLAKEDAAEFDINEARFLENVKTEDDRYEYVKLIIKQSISAGKYLEAAALGERYIKGKGILYEEQPNGPDACKRYEARFFENLKTHPLEQLINREYSSDPEILRTGGITALISDALWQARDKRAVYYHFLTCCYAEENGIFDNLETIFYNGSLRLIQKLDFKNAQILLNMGLEYVEKHGGAKSRFRARNAVRISHWLLPIEDVFELYKNAKNAAVTEGLRHDTALADLMVLDTRYFVSGDIQELEREVELFIQNTGVSFADINFKILTGVLRQFVKCINGRTASPDSFSDAAFNEEIFVSENSADPTVMYYYHNYKLISLCTNKYYEKALYHIKELEPLREVQSGSILMIIGSFFRTVVLCALALVTGDEAYAVSAAENQESMKSWAEINPGNFGHWHSIAQTLLEILNGNMGNVMSCYSKSLGLMRGKKNKALAAMLHEIMAVYWSRAGGVSYAVLHNQNAFALYKELNYFAKSQALEPEIASVTHNNPFGQTSSFQSMERPRVSNKNLDLESVLGIVTSLNKNPDIGVMSAKLLECLVQSCGAAKGFVVILSDNRPLIEAVYYTSVKAGDISVNLLPMALGKADENTFPLKAIEYVLSKRITLNINYAVEKHLLFGDAYYKINNPEAFLCIPMILKDNIIGAVYLENGPLIRTFSQHRINTASQVVAQTAAVFQNSIYYRELNNYAKTVEQRLKEHSSLLNSMIAGIAHEINTPVGVCVTVISHMAQITKSVLSKFEGQRLTKSELASYIEEISKGAEIADANISRAVHLVQNFKKVSANQSNEIFENINLFETLNNIVDYIRPAIKKKVYDIKITGDEELVIFSCAGALTQVFTNLIMNSVIHGFDGRTKDACNISISFTSDGAFVTVTYSDNGNGMSEEELQKLFQPFYTTKRHSGGSGLGAHIIFTHVTQTLGGKIHCASEPGKGADFIIKIPIEAQL